MKLKIESIRTRAVPVPMKRPLAASTGALTAAALLLIDLQTDAGIVGRSYLFGIGKRSEEHTSELQSQSNIVCRLLLEKKKKANKKRITKSLRCITLS